MAATESDKLKAVYEQICNAHNGIADFRGKLLALLPIASGAGIFLLLSKDLDSKVMPHLLAVGIFGAAVTVGLFAYELVGIHRCQTLRKKGDVIEKELLSGSNLGRFTPFPEDYYLLVKVPVASIIVYSAMIGAWTYVACIGMASLLNPQAPIAQSLITSALVILAVISLGTFIRWGQKKKLKNDARHSSVLTMIEVDNLQFTAQDHAFIQEWAEALGVSVAVLLGRILLAALEGGHYREKRPRDLNRP